MRSNDFWLRLVRQWLRKNGREQADPYNENGDYTRFSIGRDVRCVTKVTYEFFTAEDFVRKFISADVISIHAERTGAEPEKREAASASEAPGPPP